MKRPGLLLGSLAAAVVVIVVGALIAAQTASDDGGDAGDLDVALEDPQDRSLPDDEFALEPAPELDGELLPEATLVDRDGNEVVSTSWIGEEPLVINFWFSTCIPCERELADFAEVDAEMDGDVRFIGVNPIDTVPVMERFAGERGVEYELLRDERVELQQALGVSFFPYTVFVSSSGEIVEQTGVLDADGLRSKVDNLLEKEA